MKSMNRRTFLFGAFAKNPSRVENPDEKILDQNPFFKIGKVADFQIGQEVSFRERSIVIESLPEGIRVRSTKKHNCYYAISTNKLGELFVNRGEAWSQNQVFSIMTNESTCLNTFREERS